MSQRHMKKSIRVCTSWMNKQMIKTRERRLASNITRNYFNVLIWKEFKYWKLLEENLPTFEDYAPAVEIAFKGCNIICALRTFNDSKYLNRIISDSALGSRCMVESERMIKYRAHLGSIQPEEIVRNFELLKRFYEFLFYSLLIYSTVIFQIVTRS